MRNIRPSQEERMCMIYKPIINMVATAEKIKSCRKKAGFSIRQIQAVFNFSSPQAIYYWEKGINMPSIDNLIVLAKLFKCQMDDLVESSLVEISISRNDFSYRKLA